MWLMNPHVIPFLPVTVSSGSCGHLWRLIIHLNDAKVFISQCSKCPSFSHIYLVVIPLFSEKNTVIHYVNHYPCGCLSELYASLKHYFKFCLFYEAFHYYVNLK